MPANGPPPRAEHVRFLLILVLIFFLYTSPDTPPPGLPSGRDYAAERITRIKNSLDVLNATRWQDFNPQPEEREPSEKARYLNLTGFRKGDRYRGWQRLAFWKERCRLFSDEARGKIGDVEWQKQNLYQNVTGIVQGRWVRYEADLTIAERLTRGRMNLSEISPGTEWSTWDEELWTRNITGNGGKIRIRVEEKNGEEMEAEPVSVHENSIGPVRSVAATITIQDQDSTGDGWEMRVHGVHWPRTGVLVMATTSDKFAGVFGLPHLMITSSEFAASQKLLNRTLDKAVKKMERTSWLEPGSPWSSSPESQSDMAIPVPHCEFVVYVQVSPFEVKPTISARAYKDTSMLVKSIENELRFPNGAPIPVVPRLQMSTVIISPDCGFILESKGPPIFTADEGEHLVGKKQEVFVSDIHNCLGVFAIVIFCQILLLKAQSKEASTPSTVGRVSMYAISMMLFADALIFASMSLLSAASPNLFPSALLVSFMALISVMLGMKFLGAVWNSQEPERRERLRQQQQAVHAAATPSRDNSTLALVPIITAAGIDMPVQGTSTEAAPRNTPIIIPSDQDIDSEILENTANAAAPLLPTTNLPAAAATQPVAQSPGVILASIYIRSILGLTFLLLLTVTSTSWPPLLRTIYIHTLSIIYLSFPAFQIRRNIQRNCRKALIWKFIIGQCILRLTPFAYFYLRDDNILFTEMDSRAFCVLAGWVWVQCWILVAQNVLGPRWGLPKTWYVDGWNYHPILRDDNIEAGELPIGLVQIYVPPGPRHELTDSKSTLEQAERKKKENSIRTVDCAICMQALEVPVVAADGDSGTGLVAGLLERRRYMVTPCRHVFHSACLEGWMRFRLQCPICRENLPPL